MHNLFLKTFLLYQELYTTTIQELDFKNRQCPVLSQTLMLIGVGLRTGHWGFGPRMLCGSGCYVARQRQVLRICDFKTQVYEQTVESTCSNLKVRTSNSAHRNCFGFWDSWHKLVRAVCVRQRCKLWEATIFGINLLLLVLLGGTVAQNPIRVYRRILIFCMGS